MKTKISGGRLPSAAIVVAGFMLSTSSGLHAGSDVYPALVRGEGALGYYRFGDSLARNSLNLNLGSLGQAGNVTNTTATGGTDAVRAFPGALAGDRNRSQFYDSIAWGMIPYNAAMNPDNTHPFTVEAWFYPASDQINGGQCPINNRLAGSAANRTGWVFFQRAPDASYAGKSGYEGVGWNCRMYNGNGTGGQLDVISQVPYQVGKWTHVVVVYDPVEVTNATLTMYIDGVAANTNVWTGGASGTEPGYASNAPGSDVALSLGAYNNTSGAGSNPYFGAVDEFAWYAAKLTPAQILAHYQNGTNANRTIPYGALIQSANPVVYLPLDELTPGADTAINLGDLQAAGNALNSAAIKRPGTSALAGRADDGSFSGHYRGGGGSFTDIPWLAQNNPDASVAFSFELWVRPTADRMNPGPAPVNNRWKATSNRTGWVIYQRDPNPSYTGSDSSGEGVGYAFRMYTGSGSGGQDIVTYVPYNIGQWQHLVFTWEPQTDLGPSTGGSEQWQGTLTAYVNGTVCTNANNRGATNVTANYAANVNPSEDGSAAGDLAVGSYNLASGGGEEFEGDIDEVAFYNGYVLTPDQVLAHYQTATNSHPATNYETLVLMAAYDGAATTPQRTMPKTYLRFNEPAFHPVANSGSLGSLADGSLVLATNTQTGPAAPAFGGLASPNPAVLLDGARGWVALNSPSGLDISGQLTLEAWINPATVQGTVARIVSHGPASPSVVDPAVYPDTTNSGWQVSSNEVFLRIEGTGASYSVGTSDGTTFHGATAPVPAGDLGGGQWICLVGTYDGSRWTLYRNGVQVASVPDPLGALPVNGPEWAIGSTGMGWADLFSGAIDEVAIYGTALSPATVAAHYYVARNGPVSLTITSSGGTVTLAWPAGTLQHSSSLAGPYVDVPGASAPSFATTPSGTMGFYRVRL